MREPGQGGKPELELGEKEGWLKEGGEKRIYDNQPCDKHFDILSAI